MAMLHSPLPGEIRDAVRNIRGITKSVVGGVNTVITCVDGLRDQVKARRYRISDCTRSPQSSASGSQLPVNDPNGFSSPKNADGIDPNGPLIVTSNEEMTNRDSLGKHLGGITSAESYTTGGSTCLLHSDHILAMDEIDLNEPKKEPAVKQLRAGDQFLARKGTNLNYRGPSRKPWGEFKRDVTIGNTILEMAGLSDPKTEPPTNHSMPDRKRRKSVVLSTVSAAGALFREVSSAACSIFPKNNRRIYSMTRLEILERAIKDEKERLKNIKKKEKEQSKQFKKDEKKRVNEAKKAGKEQGNQVKPEVKQDVKKSKKSGKKGGDEVFPGSEWVSDQYGSLNRSVAL